MSRSARITIHTDTADFAGERTAWNDIGDPDHPFLDFEFLDALQSSGCVGEETSWQPRYFLLHRDGRLEGALTLYIKFDSYGEYIFDHGWADAYMRGGLRYYPKGLVAVPFTPANGRRFLVHPEADYEATVLELAGAVREYCEELDLSSLHFLFLSERESKILENTGFMTRLSTQFHWQNRNYANFDAFLDDLKSRKRKTIRKERETVRAQNLEIVTLTGDEIQPQHMQAMYHFYMDTGSRKWGRPYLNRAWFDRILDAFRHRLVLVLARERDGPGPPAAARTGGWVAGTLNFHKNRKLYGRYWGCVADYSCLHFELCYYQLIDYAVEHGVEVFEAGAQGEHKFARGFATMPCYSSHWMAHPEGRRAIGGFLENERMYVGRAIAESNTHSPLKHLGRPE